MSGPQGSVQHYRTVNGYMHERSNELVVFLVHQPLIGSNWGRMNSAKPVTRETGATETTLAGLSGMKRFHGLVSRVGAVEEAGAGAASIRG
jgi:hypothetical protein